MSERDILAMEAMKIFISQQGYVSMSLKHRLMRFFNINEWKVNYHYDFKDISENSYLMADFMATAKNKDKTEYV